MEIKSTKRAETDTDYDYLMIAYKKMNEFS